MPESAVQLVLERLHDAGCTPRQNGAAWSARCPAHDDAKPSLSISRGDDGRVLLHCHAGCPLDAVLDALSLTAADLFDEQRPRHDDEGLAYDYVDEAGRLLFQVVRRPGKRFVQRRPDEVDGWAYKLNGVRRVPYRLPEVAEAVAAEVDVWVAEGEKDADRLRDLGLVATTNPGGAGKWRAEYSAVLRGAHVTVVADHDEPGRAHARSVAASLEGVAAGVSVLVPPTPGHDVSDHLTAGLALGELVSLEPRASTAEPDPDHAGPSARFGRAVDGATFILNAPTEVPALWGDGDRVAWASGESLLIAGPPGVGKTTIAQQLVLARLGLLDSLLGLPVAVEGRRVLYVAADRPSQAARSFARMVAADDREVLADRLVVWPGPLPADVAADPDLLVRLAEEHEAGTVVIDSLKDVALDLAKDETGSRVTYAISRALAAGLEVCALHHQRKQQQGGGKPKALADVYGSTWLTAGAGSVLLVWGDAGDPIVEVDHLKQPAGDIGPLKVTHDHFTGRSTLATKVDPLALIRGSTQGLTAQELARARYDTGTPTKAQTEKARRRLDELCRHQQAHKSEGRAGGLSGGEATRYHAVDTLRTAP